MKVLQLTAENFKNLKVVQIRRPDGAVILTGKNEAGKSAVLDSLFVTLTGEKLEKPIRDGEKRAEINVDLGDYRVRRIFTAKGDRLEVVNKDGAVFPSPQALLDKILGNLSFDPLHFSSMKPKEQKELLAELVDLDFVALNKEREQLYNERTIKNREIKGGDPGKTRPDPFAPLPLESLVGSMKVPEPGTPREEISMAGELEKVQALEKKVAIFQEYERSRCAYSDGRAAAEKGIHDLEEEISDLERTIGLKRNLIKAGQDTIAAAQNVLDNMVAPEVVSQKQIEAARQALLDADEKNKTIRAAVEYDKKTAQLEEAKASVARLEDRMMKIDLEKQEKIKAATFPIDGLALDDEKVTFKGIPLKQISTGAQIRVSTAIAMALNPMLRVILIREGSLLDEDGLKAIMDTAASKDYQLWIERVSSDKSVGIYLEDGAIVGEAV